MRKNALYMLGRAFIKAYSSLLLKMDVHWYERRLPEGPKLFVANHPSATDPFVIHLLSHMSVMITANAFSFPLFGSYIRGAGQIAVIPGQGEEALENARRLLEAGRSVGIFPEGTFSPQAGGFHQPRTGAARLALTTGVPVIPVGIYLPRERSLKIVSRLSGRPTIGYWYLHGPYGITVGQAMRFHGNPGDKAHVQSISQSIMHWIRSLAHESEQRVRRLLPAQVAA